MPNSEDWNMCSALHNAPLESECKHVRQVEGKIYVNLAYNAPVK